MFWLVCSKKKVNINESAVDTILKLKSFDDVLAYEKNPYGLGVQIIDASDAAKGMIILKHDNEYRMKDVKDALKSALKDCSVSSYKESSAMAYRFEVIIRKK